MVSHARFKSLFELSKRLNSGAPANDQVLLGPDSVGQFIPTAVKTIQRKRASVTSGEAGQSVSFALKRIRRSQVRKGMVLIAKTDTPPKGKPRYPLSPGSKVRKMCWGLTLGLGGGGGFSSGKEV